MTSSVVFQRYEYKKIEILFLFKKKVYWLYIAIVVYILSHVCVHLFYI